MKNLPPLPSRGGAYRHDAATNTLTRTQEVTGDGSGEALPALPASASPRAAKRLASPPAKPSARGRGKSRR